MSRLILAALLAAALVPPGTRARRIDPARGRPRAPHAPARQNPAGDAAPVLTTVADVPLPGPAARFDYQYLDQASDRLYIAHMGAGAIVVFNVKTRTVEGTIRGVPGVTGVWAVPALGRVYASASRLHHVAVIDASTLQVVARLGPIGFPDGIAYAPDQRKVYVSDESGGGELVIDARTDQVAGRIPLDGEAGNTVYDAGSRCILVAVQTRNQVWVIDPNGDRVLGRFVLEGAARPHGMTIDNDRRLAFVANEGDAKLLTVDLRNMKVTGTAPVGERPDVLAIDPGWRRVYVASEIGTVTVFAEAGPGLVREGEIHIPNAHSVAVDPRTHLVYLPLQDVGGRPLLRIMTGTPPVGH